MTVEEDFAQLGREIATHVSPHIVAEFLDFIRAGEYGVGLEVLCDRLSDEEEPFCAGGPLDSRACWFDGTGAAEHQ